MSGDFKTILPFLVTDTPYLNFLLGTRLLTITLFPSTLLAIPFTVIAVLLEAYSEEFLFVIL